MSQLQDKISMLFSLTWSRSVAPILASSMRTIRRAFLWYISMYVGEIVWGCMHEKYVAGLDSPRKADIPFGSQASHQVCITMKQPKNCWAMALAMYLRRHGCYNEDSVTYLMQVAGCMFEDALQMGQAEVGHLVHVWVHQHLKWAEIKQQTLPCTYPMATAMLGADVGVLRTTDLTVDSHVRRVLNAIPTTPSGSVLRMEYGYAWNARGNTEDLVYISVSMDKWKDLELEKMKAGGNRKARDFFTSQSDYNEGWSLTEKYNSRAAALYRDKIATLAGGKPWSEETSSARNHRPFVATSPGGGGMKTSASYPRMSASSSNSGGYNGASGGGYQESISSDDIKKHKEDFFTRKQSENAYRREDLPLSQVGKYSGFSNTVIIVMSLTPCLQGPCPESGREGPSPSQGGKYAGDLPPSQGGKYAGFGNTVEKKKEDDFFENTMSSLSSGWSTFTTGATKIAAVASEKATKFAHDAKDKTLELSSTVNDSVVKPTRDKLSSVGAKGWGNLQSLWGEPKTTLNTVDTSPGEKSSLLGGGTPTHQGESGHKLLHDEDEWGSWSEDKTGWNQPGQEQDDALEDWLNEDNQSSKNKTSKNSNNADNWDDWGEQDGKAKKSLKSSQNMKKKEKLINKSTDSDGWNEEEWGPEPKSSSKSSKKTKEGKEPLVGNLLDLDINDTSNTAGENSSNWDTEVWADGDDDDWQSLDIDTSCSQLMWPTNVYDEYL
ncbi:ARFG1-like protein [Mya arenaria]|uniref:ARFG1-like protein n=1 Tax=Mya arenaria TaxID=6604 RepID=A0ABY7FKU6_MYAAR|nr:ARFG1-like protein [Mya arenaria]